MKFSTFTIARADTGAVLPFCKTSVYKADGVTLASLFNAVGGSIGNPVTGDANGAVGFAAVNGSYKITAVSADSSYTSPTIYIDIYDLAPFANQVATINGTAAEALAAGAFVNMRNNAGAVSVVNAVASDPTKFANGFVTTAAASSAAATVQPFGFNTAINPGALVGEVWLSDTTPGGFLTTPPTASGSIIQPLGTTVPGLGIAFFPQTRVQL